MREGVGRHMHEGRCEAGTCMREGVVRNMHEGRCGQAHA